MNSLPNENKTQLNLKARSHFFYLDRKTAGSDSSFRDIVED